MTRNACAALSSLLAVLYLSFVPAVADEFPAPPDTQPVEGRPSTPAEALASIDLPAGFHATLFAAEPDVRQPIACTFDARGRLWVAENYTYADRTLGFDVSLRDRIIILEDADGDGRAEKQKVFCDDFVKLTSVEIGYGGVWALCPPALLFIPDRDADDVPDGAPEVVLDGWEAEDVRHNFVNGLRWGPDGWLWGRHGILATSYVGRPGTPSSERVAINCGIWRFHPTRRVFEVVAHGTTNPWGHDWDDYGELFFINTVIGHLWHVLPGAHYERMYGEDLRPHLYSLIPQTADHFHWDTRETWSDIRQLGVTKGTDQAGGGHAHSGFMIYLGDDWPETYRNDAFTLNFHGRRVNRDRLERRGATYVGRHADDLLSAGDIWFRGIQLVYGPDGGVYILDWSDIGECHENDGVHRSSGRIYKVTYGEPSRRPIGDLAELGGVALAKLALHPNDWFVRQARRILAERAAAGVDLEDARRELDSIWRTNESIPRRLRALWCLWSLQAVEEKELLVALEDPDEHVRSWAVALLVDRGRPSERAQEEILRRAESDRSGLVLAHIASTLERLEPGKRAELAQALSRHAEFAGDPVLPRLVWYGIEPVVAASADIGARLASSARWPLLRQNVARRTTSRIDDAPAGVARLVEILSTAKDLPTCRDLLLGMREALRGRRRVDPPQNWSDAATVLEKTGGEEIRTLVRELSVVFGDGRALDELRAIASSTDADIETRRAAIRALVQARDEVAASLLYSLLDERDVAVEAVRGLAALGDEKAPSHLIDRFGRFRGDARDEVVRALASRRDWAEALIDAVAKKSIDPNVVPAFELRQMQLLGSEELDEKIADLWPNLRLLDEEKRDLLRSFHEKLSPDRIEGADPVAGRKVFEETCARCHRLFGHGGTVGPELTGGQRSDLNWLLENIVDPSATVAENYHMSVLVLDGGRVISGVIAGAADGPTITVETPEGQQVIERKDVRAIQASELSLMPEGLLATLDDATVANLIAYLMAPGDVPLPGEKREARTPEEDGAAGKPPVGTVPHERDSGASE